MINIVSCIDNNFALYCGVMLTSLFENNKDENITIHIVTDSINEYNKKNITDIAQRYNQSINFYKIDSNLISYCPIIKGRYTISTYYRILLPSLLPDNIKKVLYLDADIIICNKIDELWETNISNYSCGVVVDSLAQSNNETFERLQYSSKYKYFNAGVMLINLDYWRRNNLENKTLCFIKDHPEKIKIVDQDALNYILKYSKYNLPYKYNVLDPLYRTNPVYDSVDYIEINKAITNPVILHFSYRKPWQIYCKHPLKKEYYKYLKLSKWKKSRIKVSLYDLKWLLSYILYKIKLRKGNVYYSYIKNI